MAATVALYSRPEILEGEHCTVVPDGDDALIRRRAQAALGHADASAATDAGTQRTQIPAHGRI
jgi:hypothetical protein